MTDPTRTKILREQFTKFLRKLPDKVRKRVEEILQSCNEVNEAVIEQVKKTVEQEMQSQAVVDEINRYTWLFWQRGADFASRQLKRYGIEIVIPPSLSVLDEEAVNQLVNLQLDLIKGLSEETKKRLAFQLRNGLLKGESIRELTKRVREVTEKTKYEAERIARTEATRVFNKAAEDRYKKVGIKKYRIVEASDERTCRTCMLYHNKIFRFDDPSAPRPPLHPNCRGTIVPVVVEDANVKKSVRDESREIAFEKATEIISKIEPGKFVPDDENIMKLKTLLIQDQRFKELMGSKSQEVAEKLAKETIEIFKQNFTHHAIIQAAERGRKEGYNILDVLNVKKKGKIVKKLEKEVHKAGKSRGVYLYIVESKKDGKIITHWKITENRYNKLVRK